LASIDSSLRSARALAVLEDAGRLLDEATALLGRRAQHRVELALADDDVHLAADPAVGQQLLDVEEPAGGAVDGVLRAATAEHRPRDGDLGVVDRQGAVGVVDGEGDLGPAQWRPSGGAREDDVLHRAAAQRLRALLAERPAHGFAAIALPAAVGTHDARDTGHDLDDGLLAERLEAVESDRL
jgi:hypothetical protein